MSTTDDNTNNTSTPRMKRATHRQLHTGDTNKHVQLSFAVRRSMSSCIGASSFLSIKSNSCEWTNNGGWVSQSRRVKVANAVFRTNTNKHTQTHSLHKNPGIWYTWTKKIKCLKDVFRCASSFNATTYEREKTETRVGVKQETMKRTTKTAQA